MNNDLIIAKIGIDICLACPHEECIATENELCGLLKDEVNRIKQSINKEENARLNEALNIIEEAIKDKPIPLIKIRNDYEFNYGYLQSLIRRGFLETEREEWRNKTRILITGVKR